MKKLSSEQAKIEINRYYKEKGYRTNLADWEILKKYRNFNGILCRDFINEKASKKGILLENTDLGTISILEDEDFKYFLEAEQSKPKFFFSPAINNKGLVFILTPIYLEVSFEDAEKWINKQFNELFEKKFTIFKGEKTKFFEVSFTDLEFSEVIPILEGNKIKYKEAINKHVELGEDYMVITPDAALIYYKFPEYINFNSEKSIHEIFAIISKKENLTEKDYSIIKLLLQKINKAEFQSVKNIALGFKKKNSEELIKIFENEEQKVKAKNLIENLIVKKEKFEQKKEI